MTAAALSRHSEDTFLKFSFTVTPPECIASLVEESTAATGSLKQQVEGLVNAAVLFRLTH
jgi:hypothetical protein